MSQLDRVRNSFDKKGYGRGALITEEVFIDILNQLQGGTFDADVAIEIWEQLHLNSHQEASIDEICSTIVDAQNILIDKILQLDDEIHKLQLRRRELQNENSSHSNSELQKINLEIEELGKDQEEYNADLHLVTEPFGVSPKINRDSNKLTGLHPESYQMQPRTESEQQKDLQNLFYVALVMAGIEFLVMYKKYDFLNLLVVMTALSIFVLNYFDSTYLKICASLTGASIALDFVWLIMYAGSYWSLPLLSQHSSSESGYLKFIVFLTMGNIVAKIYLVFLVLKQKEVPPNEEFTIVPFDGVSVNVVSNTGNIISKNFMTKGSYL